MTSSLGLWAAGLALSGLPAAAGAAGITYDCDTAAGHFSELALPAAAIPFEVSGNVQLNALAESKAYAPITRIHIASPAAPGRSPDAFAGFSLSALAADGKKVRSSTSAIQMLSYNASSREDEVLPASLAATAGSVQRFTLSYDGNEVAVMLGTETKRFPLRVTEPVVRILCSTGEFLFTDLAITPLR